MVSYLRMLSDMTLTAMLRRMDRGEQTAHGFRSTVRDWAAETTAHPNHVMEAAYRRGDLFEKRTALMADWAAYLARPAAAVRRFASDLPRAANATG